LNEVLPILREDTVSQDGRLASVKSDGGSGQARGRKEVGSWDYVRHSGPLLGENRKMGRYSRPLPRDLEIKLRSGGAGGERRKQINQERGKL